MRLWLVQTDNVDYDEYDAHLIRAESAERALKVANFPKRKKAYVTEVTMDGGEEIIISSYNAG